MNNLYDALLSFWFYFTLPISFINTDIRNDNLNISKEVCK